MNQKFKTRVGKSGQMLIEAMIALSVTMIGLLGIFNLLSQSLGLNKTLIDQYAATYLAAEGIETVKNIIDTGVLQKKPWGSSAPTGIYQILYKDQDLIGKGLAGANPETNCNADYLDTNATQISFDPPSGTYGYNFSQPTPYKRAICIRALENGNKLKVNSVVIWHSQNQPQSINLEDHFYNWR